MNVAQVKVVEEIYHLASDWLAQKEYEKSFLIEVLDLAREEAPFYKMLCLWSESTKEEKNEIVADLHEMLEDHKNRPSNPIELPYVKIERLSDISKHVIEYKKFLRKKIIENGGITKVAKKAKIPQPSLSRFLNSASLPRRSTLEKLSSALKLSQADLAFDWTK